MEKESGEKEKRILLCNQKTFHLNETFTVLANALCGCSKQYSSGKHLK